MGRKMKYNIAVFAIVALIMVGLFIVMTALGNKVARWDGYADSLPFLALFVLFIVGHIISFFNSAKRR